MPNSSAWKRNSTKKRVDKVRFYEIIISIVEKSTHIMKKELINFLNYQIYQTENVQQSQKKTTHYDRIIMRRKGVKPIGDVILKAVTDKYQTIDKIWKNMEFSEEYGLHRVRKELDNQAKLGTVKKAIATIPALNNRTKLVYKLAEKEKVEK